MSSSLYQLTTNPLRNNNHHHLNPEAAVTSENPNNEIEKQVFDRLAQIRTRMSMPDTESEFDHDLPSTGYNLQSTHEFKSRSSTMQPQHSNQNLQMQLQQQQHHAHNQMNKNSLSRLKTNENIPKQITMKNQEESEDDNEEEQLTSNNNNNNKNDLNDDYSHDESANLEAIERKVSERRQSIQAINNKLESHSAAAATATAAANPMSFRAPSSEKSNTSTPQPKISYNNNNYQQHVNHTTTVAPILGTGPLINYSQTPQNTKELPNSSHSQHFLKKAASTTPPLAPYFMAAPSNVKKSLQHNHKSDELSGSGFAFEGKHSMPMTRVNSRGIVGIAAKHPTQFFGRDSAPSQEMTAIVAKLPIEGDPTVSINDATMIDLTRKLDQYFHLSRQQELQIDSLKTELHQVKSTVKQQQLLQQIQSASTTTPPKFPSSLSSVQHPVAPTQTKSQLATTTSPSDNHKNTQNLLEEQLREEIERQRSEILDLREQLSQNSIEIQKQEQMLLEQRKQLVESQKNLKFFETRCHEFELGLGCVRYETQLAEKDEEINRIKEDCAEQSLAFEEEKQELINENSDVIFKAGKLLSKYKELEAAYLELTHVAENEQLWRKKTEEKAEELRSTRREIELLESTSLKELSELKSFFEQIAAKFVQHDYSRLLESILKIAAENKALLAFQTQFYEIVTNQLSDINRKPIDKRQTQQSPQDAWKVFQDILDEYLQLRKKDRLDATLGNLLIKTLRVKDRDEIVPVFTQKIIDNEAYIGIINKIKLNLRIRADCPLDELSNTLDHILQRRMQ